jgi:hypothetical protein
MEHTLEELKSFYRDYGHTKVSRHSKEYPKLGGWLASKDLVTR